MPEKSERWGAVVLGACIGFGFVFGNWAGKLALIWSLKLLAVVLS